ncbi:hypothetical protein OROMI_001805 [Orobanche minor]
MTKHKLMLFLFGISICMILKLYPLEAAHELSLVKSLPGFQGTFPSKHYSGYVTLDGNPPKNLFYCFIVSERNPVLDPIVLWLNGGPFCSSFDGYEHDLCDISKSPCAKSASWLVHEVYTFPQRDCPSTRTRDLTSGTTHSCAKARSMVNDRLLPCVFF